MSTTRQTVGLVVAIVICFAAGGIGNAATMPELAGWYAGIAKPTWTPPGWVFGPVWSLLYVMMALAAWQVWRRAGADGAVSATKPLAIFVVQLVLNALWSVIFFGMHEPGWAAVELAVLWIAIAATLILFWRRSTPAGVLLAPYLTWVSFALLLNIAIWRMNA
ncbi:MAG: tryptophan-rich sensory protein [Phycisphaera sp.]|nr:tryptophan-rich sensory protein [Phycisphaera sp.]